MSFLGAQGGSNLGSVTGSWGLDFAIGLRTGVAIVHKYGHNSAVGGSAFETLWDGGGAYPFPAAASTVNVASGSGNDTSGGSGAQTVRIIGLDNAVAPAEELVTLNGVTDVETSTSWWRINRMFVETCGTYGGTNEGAITATPTPSGSSVISQITTAFGQTQQLVYSIAAGKVGYLAAYSFYAESLRGADIRVWSRGTLNDTATPVSPVRLRGRYELLAGSTLVVPLSCLIKVDGGSDIWVNAEGTGGAAVVGGTFCLILVDD